MRPPNSDLARSPRDRKRAALVVTLLGTTGLATPALGCMEIDPDDSAAVSIELGPGTSQDFSVDVFDSRDEEGNVVGRNCYASVAIPLAAFPSVSHRLDTAAVARAIQESAAALGVESCDVSVYYDDPEQELTMGERCVRGTYGFSENDFWSRTGEEHCWSDEDIAQWQELERQAAAQADAYAAEQEAIAAAFEEEWGEEYDDAVAVLTSEDLTLRSVAQ